MRRVIAGKGIILQQLKLLLPSSPQKNLPVELNGRPFESGNPGLLSQKRRARKPEYRQQEQLVVEQVIPSVARYAPIHHTVVCRGRLM